MTVMFIGFCLVFLVELVQADIRQNQQQRQIFKPLASLSFILVGLTQTDGSPYANWIVMGLILGAIGDVLLLPDDKPNWFLAGVGVFLLGHIAYIIAFHELIEFSDYTFIGIVPFMIGGAVYSQLWGHLGSMKLPVGLYVVIISLMVAAALTVYAVSTVSSDMKWVILVGAICFYFSDLAVAVDRFVKPWFNNAIWGLPLYYVGQLLLAYSAGML